MHPRASFSTSRAEHVISTRYCKCQFNEKEKQQNSDELFLSSYFFFVHLTLLPDNLPLRQTSDCTLTCFLLLFYPPGDLMLRMLKNAVFT